MFSFPLKAMVSGFWFFALTSKGGEALTVLLLLQGVGVNANPL
jgi:hypothetical protein